MLPGLLRVNFSGGGGGGGERGRGGRRKFVRHYSFQKKTGNLCDGLVFLGRGGLY